MSTPLIDISANPRQPDFNPTKVGSKIPSPPKYQRTGSTGRRNPFSVSTTGSPCYIATPMDAKAVIMPMPTSKLPRKSTPTQSAYSKSYTYGIRPVTTHASLPQSRNWQKPAAIVVPPGPNSIRTTPPLSCNKPLPSPPMAQIVNPASPPKAQRTLIDADAGTPTEEAWPVLQPENVPPSKSRVFFTNGMLPQRSASEGSALRRNGIPVLKSPDATPSVSNGTPSSGSESSIEEGQSDHPRPRVMTEPRMFGPINPYAESFHAFSTDSNVAIDSPLAQKQQNLPPVAIPPRISSKHTSLPSPDTAADVSSAQQSASLRPVKSGCTKWPDLAPAEETMKAQAGDETFMHGKCFTKEPENNECVSFDAADVTQPRYGSIDSVSTWSLAVGLSLDDEPEVNYEGSVRIKRLSWYSSKSGSGPTLRISADADAVLLGREDSIPAVPDVPEQILRKPSQERSNGPLPGRVSRQILVSMGASKFSRTSTPSSTETETIGSRPVKITPIRSMQPPRKTSTDDLSKGSPSPSMPASMGALKVHQVPDPSQAQPRGSVKALQESVSRCAGRTSNASEDQLMSKTESSTSLVTSGLFSRNAYEAGNFSTKLKDETSQKAAQVLGTDENPQQLAASKRLPMTWMTPKATKFTIKKSAATRSKTNPLLRSTGRVDNGMSAISTRSPSSASSSLAYSGPFPAGARQMGPSRLGVSESVAQDFSLILCDSSGSGPRTDVQDAANITLRRRAKRGFKNVFGRRDPKATPQPAKDQKSKRSSVASSALAQRIRNSTNFSKVSLARPSTAKADIQEDTEVCADSVEILSTEQGRQTVSALDSTTETAAVDASTQPAPLPQYETATVINNILDSVTLMKKDFPDCLRGLEIAEAVLHAIDCSKQARLSAELARKHARDAELKAERAGIELQRLEKLCESGFDSDTMQAIRQLTVMAGVAPLRVMIKD
ncbi:hypothetical protein E8E12_006374 [Didymella heteroderae]|uniref:Uncharacterized protein n=1 Tax=Didymella heteroderae TaxID=1769908 RepID=A0A9P4WUF8_9PLEO|nr:hypothetical protein E8E12_006374 [Didymella heteroderae]